MTIVTNTAVGKKSVAVRGVIHNVDGSVKEDRGLMAYWHRNIFINFAVNAYIRIRDLAHGRSRPK